MNIDIPDYRCRCIDPPPNTPFEKGRVYKLIFMIDGIGAVTEDGYEWWANRDIEFYWYFQMLPDKKEYFQDENEL